MKNLTFAIAAATLGATAHAQQYLDTFKYKGSHNSYERGLHPGPGAEYAGARVPMNDLVLAWNSYSVEFDLCADADDGLILKHDCTFLTGEFSAGGFLQELFSDPRIHERVTWINLELKFSGCCDNWIETSGGTFDCVANEQVLLLWLDGAIDLNRVYTYLDWVADGRQWPTMPELIARGKTVIVAWGRDCTSDWFFASYERQSQTVDSNDAYVNYEDDDKPAEIDAVGGDRWMLSSYPTVYYDSISSTGWQNAAALGTNHLRTNAYADAWTKGNGVHHAYPMYIDAAVPGGAPQFGTPYLPFKGLVEGFQSILSTTPRAEYSTPIRVRPGTYKTTPTGVIDMPVTIEARGGPVTLIR